MSKDKHEYTKGLVTEQQIIDALGLTPSSRQDNIHNDIDAYTSGHKYGISIKTQFIAKTTGNLALELQVRTKGGEWVDSWALTGKADLILFHVPGKGTYLMHKEQKQKLLGLPLSCPHLTTRTLSNRVKKSQHDINHYHTDARLLIAPIDWLLSEGYLVEKPKFHKVICNHNK